MNTNAIPIIQTAAQHAGITLSQEQIYLLIGAAAAAARWLHVEIPIWIAAYAKVGGLPGIVRFLKTGSSQPQPPKP